MGGAIGQRKSKSAAKGSSTNTRYDVRAEMFRLAASFGSLVAD
jgi:hypothetical protein